MNPRIRITLAAAAALFAVGIASPVSAQNLAQGERPRENKMTREAVKQMGLAAAAASPEAAAPYYQVALDSANSAIRENAKNPLGHRLAAEALIGLNRLQEADAALDMAEQLRPIYVLETEGVRERAWIDQYNRAQPFLTSGDYLAAAEVLEGANAMYRERPEIMIVLGQIYAQENQPDKAIAHLQTADSLIKAKLPELDSANAEMWRANGADIPVTIAQAYISAKRFDEAAASLKALVDANPTNLVYARSLANIYAQSEKPDLALAVYMSSIQNAAATPSDLYSTGVGLYTMNKFAEASQAFGKAAQQAPKDRDSFEMWARTLQLAQSGTGAEPTAAELADMVKAAEGWVALDPQSRVGMLILAQTQNKAKNETAVQEIVQKMEALTVGVGDLQLRRGANGGGDLSGVIENYTVTEGTVVNLTFTFYDKTGIVLGTQAARALAGAPSKDTPAKSPFNVTFTSDKTVDGYTYTVGM